MTRRDRPEQLDIPLVWETEEERRRGESTAAPFRERPASGEPCGSWRLVLAALADLGITLVGLAAVGAVAVALGAELVPLQMLMSAVIGLEVVSLIGSCTLWGWRATPGMLILNTRFESALPLGRAATCWLAWMSLLPVASAPLLVGRRGRRLLERLGGARVSCQPNPSGA